MSFQRYLLGLVLFGMVVGALWLGAAHVRARLLPRWVGAEARLAEAVLALVAFFTVAHLLGALGLFRTAPMVLACVLAGAAAMRWSGRLPWPSAGTADSAVPAPSRRDLAVTALTVGGALALWAAFSLHAVTHGMHNVDTLGYHGPFFARFVDDGLITDPFFTTNESYTTWFPATSELLHGLGQLSFGRDLLSPTVNLGWVSLGLLAGWCIGRPHGAGPSTLIAAAAVLCVPILVTTQAGEAKNDLALVPLVLCTVALLLRAEDSRPAFALAGMTAGIGLGTKVTAIPPVLVLTLAVLVAAPRGRRRRDAGLWLGAVAFTGSFWYVRNLIAIGNPLPWAEGVGPIELPHLETPVTDRFHDTMLQYLTDSQVWERAFLPGLWNSLGWTWPVLLGLAVAGGGAALLIDQRRIVKALGAVALVGIAAHVVTPASAGPDGDFFAVDLRYVTPSIAIGICLLPLARPLLAPGRRTGLLVVLTVLFGLTALDAALEQLIVRRSWAPLILPSALSAAAVMAAAWWWAARRAPRRAPLAVAGALACVVGAGWWMATEHRDGRYRHPSTNYPKLNPVYEWARTVVDSRIAVSGTYLLYPLFGPDLSNHVQHAGREDDGGNFRRLSNCTEWRAFLRDGRYRYAVVAPNGTPFLKSGEPPARAWTSTSTGATEIRRFGTVSVFRLDRAPDPTRCRS